MLNSLSVFVGIRYSRGRNRNRFGSAVALFSLIGMALGVTALILVLSVMNGFNAEIAGRLQTLSPHITLLSSQGAEASSTIAKDMQSRFPEIAAMSPTIESFAVLNLFDRQQPVKLMGIEPQTDGAVVDLPESLVLGQADQLQAGSFGIILGAYTAAQMNVQIGDSINMVLPRLRTTPVGLFPRQKTFRVVDVFSSGSQLDSDVVYAHINDVSVLLRTPVERYGWRVRLDDLAEIEDVQSRFNSSWAAEGWNLHTWESNYASLFQAMRMEKVTVGALLMIIVIVAAFNIVSGLIMMVSDKRSDMAVLRTMGASSGAVVRIFVVQGLILGVAGIFFGAILGTLLALFLPDIVSFFERLLGGVLFDPNIFYVSFLPTEWRLHDFLWVLGLSFLLTLFATILPAMQAAKISPREALNYKQ